MREIDVALITEAVSGACIKANKFLPDDLAELIKNSAENETDSVPKDIMCRLCDNLCAAKELDIPTREAAMTRTEAIRAILTGIEIVGMLKSKSYEILATGEMGIGNTTTSSAVASVLTDIPVKLMTGRGAGLSADGLRRKIAAIERAISLHAPDRGDPIDIISKVGGFDIAGLTGVFLGGAIFRIPIVIDGFISSVAALCAARLVPDCIGYMLPSHCSGEPAASKVLDELGLSALLDCGMSLGEGSGAVAVMPLLEMGLSVYKSMSTFEEIRVEQYEELK